MLFNVNFSIFVSPFLFLFYFLNITIISVCSHILFLSFSFCFCFFFGDLECYWQIIKIMFPYKLFQGSVVAVKSSSCQSLLFPVQIRVPNIALLLMMDRRLPISTLTNLRIMTQQLIPSCYQPCLFHNNHNNGNYLSR